VAHHHSPSSATLDFAATYWAFVGIFHVPINLGHSQRRRKPRRSARHGISKLERPNDPWHIEETFHWYLNVFGTVRFGIASKRMSRRADNGCAWRDAGKSKDRPRVQGV
jgi:hypothetical protein